ncbi:hypothetical protein GUJ93_ZPchr0011g27361 [Zizania palustris]|nr:hypothetical protein GUJ93_ZPchr0011g27361 [Zizania palustris]
MADKSNLLIHTLLLLLLILQLTVLARGQGRGPSPVNSYTCRSGEYHDPVRRPCSPFDSPRKPCLYPGACG